MARRTLRGYMGRNHETIGSDIQAVLRSLTFPRSVLGDGLTDTIEAMGPNEWYPIATLLDLMDVLEQKLGETGLRKLGRALFKTSHEERARHVLRSARDVCYGIDGM